MNRYAYSRNGELGHVDEKCLVRVQVPSVDTAEDGKVRYHVRVTNVRSGQVWEVARRFSEFLKLRNELIAFFANADKKCPGCRNYEKVLQVFEFPRKHVFTSVTPVVIKYRKTALRNFIALLASHTFTTTPKCPTCSGFPFTGVRDWLTTDMVSGNSPTNAAGGTTRSPTNEEVRDTMDVKAFTAYHRVTNEVPVDQEGRFYGSTVKYTPPVVKAESPKKKKTSKPHVRKHESSQDKQYSPKKAAATSELRFSDSLSSTGSSSDPQSPPSVDGLILPPGAPVATEFADEATEENDVEGFTSFVGTSSAAPNGEQPAQEPPAGEDTSAIPTQTKKHFKFTRASSVCDPVEQRESSMINIDGLEDEEDEVNMDFMNAVSLAPTAAK